MPIADGERSGAASTNFTAGIEVETPHASLGRAWDLAFDFALDRQPLFSMTKNGATAVPRYTGGFTTSSAFRLARAFSSSEVALVGRAGIGRIDDASSAAANAIGPATAFYDATIDLRWFGKEVSLVHRTAQTLMPILQGYAGLRHDQRYHRAGDLSGFDDPTGRVVAGVITSPIRIGDRGARERPGATIVAIGGGFEWQRALRGAVQLPSGYEAMLRADVDVAAAVRRRD